jgi:uncharacterized membrane protein YcjF (UPF0283 family)
MSEDEMNLQKSILLIFIFFCSVIIINISIILILNKFQNKDNIYLLIGIICIISMPIKEWMNLNKYYKNE